MASSAHRTIECIWPNEPCILNLGGYGPGGKPDSVSYARRFNNYLRELRLMGLFTGPYKPWIVLSGVEPTLVITGTLSDDAASHLGLYELLVANRQDCCAIYYPSWKQGYLYGPVDDQWGEFDINKFCEVPNA